jgi:hypothetical protein
LDNLRVQLGPSSQGPGLLHSCTALTRLEVASWMLLDRKTDAPVVPLRVAKLKHLELCFEVYSDDDDAQAEIEDMPESRRRRDMGQALEKWVAPHLTSLTHLTLGGDASSSHLHLSNMLGLQEFDHAGETEHWQQQQQQQPL